MPTSASPDRPAPAFHRRVEHVLNARNEADARASFGRLMVKVRADLAKTAADIEEAETRGEKAKTKAIRHHLQGSFVLRLYACNRAAQKMNGMQGAGGERRPPIPVREVIEMARRLDLREESHNPVRVRAIPKRGAAAALAQLSGEPSRDPADYRYVCNFEFEDRARQYALLWLASVGPARQRVEGQYVGAEDGFIQMQKDIIADLDAGYIHVWTGDLRNCFRHVDPRTLNRKVGVSKRVLVNNALFSPDRVVFTGMKGGVADRKRTGKAITLAEAQVEDCIEEHATLLAPQGLPQGSAASPKLAQIALAALPGRLPADTRLSQWVDDIQIRARTREEAAVAKASLLAALSSGDFHGQYEVKRPDLDVVDARRGYEFCGVYYYQHDDRFYARPATKRLTACEAKIKACAALGVVHPWWLAKAERILDGFLRNYPCWHVAHLFRARMMQHIKLAHFLRRLTGQAPAPQGARPPARGEGPQGRHPVGWIPEKEFRTLRVITGLVEPGCKRGSCDDLDEDRWPVRRRLLPLAA